MFLTNVRRFMFTSTGTRGPQSRVPRDRRRQSRGPPAAFAGDRRRHIDDIEQHAWDRREREGDVRSAGQLGAIQQ